ncbi:FAD-binding oxidoreductase [Variovorax sp. J22G21]|uniref:NAD(P)/FAD-dependent oxidoreductase n=1 Tax=Variovorax fucosicus TaxID=3053517 RepID=UPI002574E190|nr:MULTISPECIES: FAD-binding oxidoreductase [unclassified Variovorax]MDM0041372.1 FAD-binding oxidoreductase [Variovorax sp. J22R193]MDM0060428.1 FAD-binding oxidoreductase [Variovorax sp. J22G21]
MREFDIIILGAGIAGASAAFRLAGHRSVLLLERESQPGYHSTGRSAAMFMESYGPPAVRALTRASRAFYEQPPAGFTSEPLLTPRGVLYLATHGQEAQLQSTRSELAPACPDLELFDADATLARVSCLRPEMVHAALFEPGAQDIDVHALHQGFLRGFRQLGGELRTGVQPRAAMRSGTHWDLQLPDGETVRARSVVNAAGAWADEVAALFGAAPIGLVPHRRSAFTFKAPDGTDASGWPAVVGVDESYYFKPDAGQLLGSPGNADPTVPHDVVPEEIDIAMGIHQIESVSTLSIRRPTSTWAGLRSFVRDGEMVIGEDGACPGFFWLAAQGGYGIQSAAAASALADALLRDVPLPEELVRHGVEPSALSPARLR